MGTLSGYTYNPGISKLGTLQLELSVSLYIHGKYVYYNEAFECKYYTLIYIDIGSMILHLYMTHVCAANTLAQI